jgi:hypothetical protein
MLFKEKQSLGDFIALAVTGSFVASERYDWLRLFNSYDPHNLLTTDETEVITSNLRSFFLIVLFWLLINNVREGKLNATADDVGYHFAKQIAFAYSRLGLSQDDADAKATSLLQALDTYAVPDDAKDENDIGLSLCRQFAAKFLSEYDPLNQTQVEKHFVAFGVARELYLNTANTLRAILKKVRVRS